MTAGAGPAPRLSRRVPAPAGGNAWTSRLEELRRRGARLLDLTDANPTSCGLAALGDPERTALASASGAAAAYAPDPRGSAVARAAVSAYYGERGLAVAADDVVLVSGTSEAYAHLFRLLADAGEAILVPQPSYPLFEPIAALEAVRPAAYRLEWQRRWSLDPAALAAAAGEGARAVVVVQPNHPTGSCLDAGERAALEDVALARGLAVIADEVFGDFPWPRESGAAGNRALPSLLERARVPTFALSGLSKVCGLPQLKLSWIVAAGPEPAKREALAGLEWIADLFLSVAAPVQAALPVLLAGRHVFQERVRARIATNLECVRALVGRRPELEWLAADGGWVAVLRVPARRSDEEWALRLLDAGVIVHPGHFYDFAEPWFLVVSLIVPEAAFAAGLGRLEETVAGA